MLNVSQADGPRVEYAIAADVNDLASLYESIRQATGVDFSGYKPGTVQRRILRRMGIKNIAQLSDYVRYVRQHRAEAEALCQDLLISVTNFFSKS
jgi:two-component system, chemotaxis family, CheB/CheR fusion protein